MTDQTDTKVAHFEIEVNGTHFAEREAVRTGLQIKEDAITAGANIKVTYVLDEETPTGSTRIGDSQEVTLHSGMKFIAHPGGSDS